MRRFNGRLTFSIEEWEMGKKYDAYAKAAQAERQANTRLQAEMIGGDEKAIYQAQCDAKQNHDIALATFDEFTEDPTG